MNQLLDKKWNFALRATGYATAALCFKALPCHGKQEVSSGCVGASCSNLPVLPNVFDQHGRPTPEAIERIEALQKNQGIHIDGKVGRQTFNYLFNQKYTQAPHMETHYQSTLKDFASAFYAHNDESVKPASGQNFDMQDNRVSKFREGLDALKKEIAEGKTPTTFGRDGALTPDQLQKVKGLADKMLKTDGQLTTEDVKIFSGNSERSWF